MNNYILFILLVLGIEILVTILFVLLSKLSKRQKSKQNKVSVISVLKGLVERGFIAFSLTQNFPQVFTVFAALKIATRIKDDSNVSNDFYLIGNIISITLAIIYFKMINYYLV